MAKLTIDTMASKVYWQDPDYFETVAFPFITEAVETTQKETGMPLDTENISAYEDYIKENLI